MSHPHRKPITAAEFRGLHSTAVQEHHLFLYHDDEEFYAACMYYAEHIALALEAMEERANSEVM